MPKAKAAVRRAIELDETVAEAHATLGVILALYDWDWAGAERELIRSDRVERGVAGLPRRIRVLLPAARWAGLRKL